jgi:acylphosphatase
MPLQARLTITGRVQGVGYRDWALTTGRRLGLSGWVRNRSDGSVEALIAGEDTAVGTMIEACQHGPALARVDAVDVEPVDLDILPQGFTQLPTV